MRRRGPASKRSGSVRSSWRCCSAVPESAIAQKITPLSRIIGSDTSSTFAPRRPRTATAARTDSPVSRSRKPLSNSSRMTPTRSPRTFSVERREVVRYRDARGEFVLRIVARDRPEDQRRIRDGSRHRAGCVHRPDERHDPVTAHPPPGRSNADNAVIGGGVADRPAGVFAQRRRAERSRCRDATAGAGGAGIVLDVPRIPRLAERPVARSEHAALRHVQLAEQDRARVAKPRDRRRVLVRHEVGERSRAVRRADALREELILHRDGDPMQRTELSAAHHRGLSFLRLLREPTHGKR